MRLATVMSGSPSASAAHRQQQRLAAAKVTVMVGENIIESVITRQSVEEMGLKLGDTVTALIKSTKVMLMTE